MCGPSPPKSSPWQAPSCIGAQVLPPIGVGEKTCATRVGLGEGGACGVGGRGSGRGRQRPQCGVLPGGTERPFKQSQEGDDPGSKQGT